MSAPPVMQPERDDLSRYLEDTIVIDWQTPAVCEKARELVQGLADEEARARALFEWVRDEVTHSLDLASDETRDSVPCNASHVLREGTGLCYAKSHLLAALLRACGIPAGFCYQRLRATPPARGHALHGFVAAYLHGPGRWVLLDPRGDNDQVRTVFSTAEPSLAYLVDPDEGERFYDTIFTRPARRVIEVLDHAERLSAIRNHLPDEL